MPFKLNIPRIGGSCGSDKRRYHSFSEAEAHRKALEQHEQQFGRPQGKVGEVATYLCVACQAWHCGHNGVEPAKLSHGVTRKEIR